VTHDLDTLLTALHVKVDDELVTPRGRADAHRQARTPPDLRQGLRLQGVRERSRDAEHRAA